MRVFWLLIFVIFVAIMGVFAFENSESVAIIYRDQSLSVQTIQLPMSALTLAEEKRAGSGHYRHQNA